MAKKPDGRGSIWSTKAQREQARIPVTDIEVLKKVIRSAEQDFLEIGLALISHVREYAREAQHGTAIRFGGTLSFYIVDDDAPETVNDAIDLLSILHQLSAIEKQGGASWNVPEPSATVANSHTFTGSILDTETQLYYCRARYYDSQLGRFTARDPIGYAAQSTSNYRYAKSNPLSWVDYSGLLEIKIDTGVPNNSVVGMPVYVDPVLDNWTNVQALNNLCIKLKGTCKDGKLDVDSVEFNLFITIRSEMRSSVNLRFYGHEQRHIATMIREIEKRKKEITNSFSGVTCEGDGSDALYDAAENTWGIVGRGFLHRWPGGGNRLGPGWKQNIKPKGNPTFPCPQRPDVPRDKSDNWFCSMDQVLHLGRPWPDWEFAQPDKKPPWAAIRNDEGMLPPLRVK